jgi:hypothetical protein
MRFYYRKIKFLTIESKVEDKNFVHQKSKNIFTMEYRFLANSTIIFLKNIEETKKWDNLIGIILSKLIKLLF